MGGGDHVPARRFPILPRAAAGNDHRPGRPRGGNVRAEIEGLEPHAGEVDRFLIERMPADVERVEGLADGLGSSDQAHLTPDFSATVGMPPDRSARTGRLGR
jgi:hypothetical protein